MTPANGPRPEPVQVTIPVTFTVDTSAYAAEYGETLPGTPEAFAVGELEELLATLPAHYRTILGTPHIGEPQPSINARYRALEANLLTETQEFLERFLGALDYTAATGVVYAASEYEDGWFVVPHAATVYFANDAPPRNTGFTVMAYEQAGRLDTLLTQYTGGPRGPQSAVSVDLVTGEVAYDAAGEHEFRRHFTLAAHPGAQQ